MPRDRDFDAENMPYDTTKPATIVNMPYDTSKPSTIVNMPYNPLTAAVQAVVDEQKRFQNAQAMAADAAAKPVPYVAPTKVTVKPGDTLSAIAKANNMTLAEIRAINPAIMNNPKYNDGNMIWSGTKIVVDPGQGTKSKVKTPVVTSPVVTSPVVTSPVVTSPVVTSPVVTSPVVTSPVVTSPVVTSPVVTSFSTSYVTDRVVDPVTAATTSVNSQIQDLLNQIANMQTAMAQPAKVTVAYEKTVRKTGGVVEVYQVMSDGTIGQMVDSYTDFGARDSVLKMFENTGLGKGFMDSLMDSIDSVYRDNIMPTDAQVLNSIYDSEAYKTRFAANETIAQRMKDGKGRPGDKLLSPYEYIQAEAGYRRIMAEAGLPSGFYDTQDDFRRLLENSVSAAELTDRVNIARNALQNADQATKDSLKNYYNMTDGEMAAYLLDSEKAFDVINSKFRYTTAEAQQMYGAAEIGGAALRAKQLSDKEFSEEIYKSGKGAQAEGAFQSAATNQADYRRLMGLYGEQAGDQDLAREELALTGGTDVTIKKKKLASKERAMFAQKSAIDATSLGRRSKKADV
jgi:LysM repeat protein